MSAKSSCPPSAISNGAKLIESIVFRCIIDCYSNKSWFFLQSPSLRSSLFGLIEGCLCLRTMLFLLLTGSKDLLGLLLLYLY